MPFEVCCFIHFAYLSHLRLFCGILGYIFGIGSSLLVRPVVGELWQSRDEYSVCGNALPPVLTPYQPPSQPRIGRPIRTSGWLAGRTVPEEMFETGFRFGRGDWGGGPYLLRCDTKLRDVTKPRRRPACCVTEVLVALSRPQFSGVLFNIVVACVIFSEGFQSVDTLY